MAVVKRNEQSFVKLLREERNDSPGVFDVSPYYICKLIDAVSNGNILDYIVLDPAPTSRYVVNSNLTIENFAEYLASQLSNNNKAAVFGNVTLDTKDAFISHFYFNNKEFNDINIIKEVTEYINDNFDYYRMKHKRKLTSHYKNN